ncbi:MAG: hypothetical protein AAF264_00735, partial [Pseudomonadota bacterium]
MMRSVPKTLAGALIASGVLLVSASAQHMMQSMGIEEVLVDEDLRATTVTPTTRSPRSDGERVVMDAEASLEQIQNEANQARVFFEPRGLTRLVRERPDVVLLMRHGKTDWSFLDV